MIHGAHGSTKMQAEKTANNEPVVTTILTMHDAQAMPPQETEVHPCP